MALTVSPPLVKINMEPGERWSSALKVVNNNEQVLRVYASVVDFKSKDDGGLEFLADDPSAAATSTFLTSKWITVSGDPFEIPPMQSIEIPFRIEVPTEAEPGGHYAAIMTGTKPQDKLSGSGVNVSSMISTLILLKVKGEVIEKGRILEFSSSQRLYQNPNASLGFKFENIGNSHLLPQGDIKVFDPYNNEVGNISINKGSDFGHVLPKSSRRWNFDWQGEGGLTKMGKYKAVLVLSYGDEAKQSDLRTAFFWFINFKTVGMIAGPIILALILLIVFIRFHVRRAVLRTQRELGLLAQKVPASAPAEVSDFPVLAGPAGESPLTDPKSAVPLARTDALKRNPAKKELKKRVIKKDCQ